MAVKSINQWRLQDLAVATSGRLLSPMKEAEQIIFDSVSTDSRTIKPGALYIAINGERFNGHQFIQQAVQKGAVALLVSEPVNTDMPTVQVNDTRLALGQFSAWHRQQMPLKKLIAVTGSNGKTTTKNLIAHILGKCIGSDKVLFTQGNLNNDFGVPRTLLDITPMHEYAIIEMGANHRGEIRYLTHLAKPDIVLITLAAGAHLEGFGSLQGVIETKSEIIEGLVEEGVAILNIDSPGYDYWYNKIATEGNHIQTFGTAKVADYRIEDFHQTENSIKFNCRCNGLSYTAELPLLGEHNAMNATAAIAVAMTAGFQWDQIRPALLSFEGVKGRLQVLQLPYGKLIDDSYNANPNSVKAAIKTISLLPGRAVACLGAMAELGETTEKAHLEVAEEAKANGILFLFVYGEAAKPMMKAFGEGAEWFTSHEVMAKKVLVLLRERQVENCLIKGSRSAEMEKVSQIILENLDTVESI